MLALGNAILWEPAHKQPNKPFILSIMVAKLHL